MRNLYRFQNERSESQLCASGGKNVQNIRYVDHKIDGHMGLTNI